MSIVITATANDGREADVGIDRLPDQCPICHRKVSVEAWGAIVRWGGTDEHLEVVFRCPNQKCDHLFIACYREMGAMRPWVLMSLQPSTRHPATFSKDIESLSPDFVTIFNQAEEAQRLRLDAICGPGYRKALEFLVKDYAIENCPDDAETIKAMFLGACIAKYVDDANIRTCAERAAWLGNDETHYVRRWEEHDIKDLIILIQLTVRWIDSEILTRKYGADMEP